MTISLHSLLSIFLLTTAEYFVEETDENCDNADDDEGDDDDQSGRTRVFRLRFLCQENMKSSITIIRNIYFLKSGRITFHNQQYAVGI